MAERRSGCARWLLGCFGLLAVSTVLCCCGGFITLRFFPMVFLSFLVEDQPLAGAVPEPAPVATKLERALQCVSLVTTGSARISPEAMTRILVREREPKLRVLQLGAEGDEASLDLSVATDETPARYFNLSLQGSFTLEQGWFTDLRFSRAVVSGHDLSRWLVGQQLAQQANQSMANQRSQNPDVGPTLDSIERFTVSDGAFQVSLASGGVAMERLCGDGASTGAP